MPSAESFSSRRRSVCKRACSRLAGWRRSVPSQAESPITLTTSLGQSLVIQKSPTPVSDRGASKPPVSPKFVVPASGHANSSIRFLRSDAVGGGGGRAAAARGGGGEWK